MFQVTWTIEIKQQIFCAPGLTHSKQKIRILRNAKIFDIIREAQQNLFDSSPQTAIL